MHSLSEAAFTSYLDKVSIFNEEGRRVSRPVSTSYVMHHTRPLQIPTWKTFHCIVNINFVLLCFCWLFQS